MKLATLAILSILTTAIGCSGSDVKVIRIDDGAVVGELGGSLFQKYRDMVIGIDEVHGKIAVIEWGDQTSTLKIVTIQPWQVSKHSVDVGRVTGLDGPMSFDFASNRLVYATDMYTKGKQSAIVAIGWNGDKQKRRYQTPTPKNHMISNLIATPEGIFFEAAGEDGHEVYRVTPDADSGKEVYRSSGRLRIFGVSGGDLCIVDDSNNAKASVRLILMDRASLAKTERVLVWRPREYAAQSKEVIVQLSRDEKTLHRIPIASPGDPREFNVPPPAENYRIYGLACSRDYALLTEENNVNGARKAIILDFRTGRAKEVNTTGFQAPIETLRLGGKDYAVLSE